MPSKKKFLAAAALTASLTAGGAVGAMFGAPTLSSAQTQPEQGVERSERPEGRPDGPGRAQSAPRAAQDGEEGAARQGHPEGRPHHPGRRIALEAAAEALGMTPEELKAELRSGKSVRTVAEERNVDPQTVIDAVVAALTEHARERATEFVNRTRPAGGPDGEGRRGPDERAAA